MKIEINKTGKPSGEMKYPCVMVDANGSRACIATSEEAGIEFSPKSFGACLALGPTKWTDAGYSPAVGPITITLTND